jgi:hypothetical protein
VVLKCLVVVTCVLAAGVGTAAQSTDLDRVLALTSEYLLRYEKELSAVVAEEHYDQWIDTTLRGPAASTGRMREPAIEQGPAKRSLVSDFLMIRWPGEAAWFGFRDVRLVDGRPVRDRDERLLALFTRNPSDVLKRADLIAAESARYNIGGVLRNINVPTQALDVLHLRHRSRFHFRKSGDEVLDGTTTWKLEFEERERPYLIGTPSGGSVQSKGYAWLDPADGSVLQTQLNLSLGESRQLLRTRITVTFRHEPSLGLRVPAELRETHEQADPASRFGAATMIEGRARYRNYRRFTTETKEQLTP